MSSSAEMRVLTKGSPVLFWMPIILTASAGIRELGERELLLSMALSIL